MSSKTNRFACKLARSIRKGTEHELEDAFCLASLLGDARESIDSITFQFSTDLFVAVSLCVVHGDGEVTLRDVLNELLDPSWDTEMQMLCHFGDYYHHIPIHSDTMHWFAGFAEKTCRLDSRRAQQLVRRCHHHWKKAMSLEQAIPAPGSMPRKIKPRRSVQVFNPDEVAMAMEQLNELSPEKRAGGDRILDNALLNDGLRQLPDVRKASKGLENAQATFENLAAPLSRLQLDLVLSAAMAPSEFHITPILLLGDPG